MNSASYSIKGTRTMSQGFVAQYAAEAALHVEGVLSLDKGIIVTLKEAFGGEHEGYGVRVVFLRNETEAVNVTVFPIVRYGFVMPDVAWHIQEQVKSDVERFTGLSVETVNVHICGVMEDKV